MPLAIHRRAARAGRRRFNITAIFGFVDMKPRPMRWTTAALDVVWILPHPTIATS
jgi:hypothetical protein